MSDAVSEMTEDTYLPTGATCPTHSTPKVTQVTKDVSSYTYLFSGWTEHVQSRQEEWQVSLGKRRGGVQDWDCADRGDCGQWGRAGPLPGAGQPGLQVPRVRDRAGAELARQGGELRAWANKWELEWLVWRGQPGEQRPGPGLQDPLQTDAGPGGQGEADTPSHVPAPSAHPQSTRYDMDQMSGHTTLSMAGLPPSYRKYSRTILVESSQQPSSRPSYVSTICVQPQSRQSPHSSQGM